jgi:hypothetical protein
MGKRKADQTNLRILNRLVEYSKYLYEEEKARTERIERKLNLFGVMIGGSIIGVLVGIPFEKVGILYRTNRPLLIVLSFLLASSAGLLLLSSVFVFLVYRVRGFERPSDPKVTALKAMSMTGEGELLKTMVADYSVAANRSHELNNKKVRHLSHALESYLSAFVLFVITMLLMSMFAHDGVVR